MAKLTINLPDKISRRAKARAALEGKTITQVIRERLEEYSSGLDLVEDAQDVRLVQEIEARLAAGEETLTDHEEVWADIDALESRGELPD